MVIPSVFKEFTDLAFNSKKQVKYVILNKEAYSEVFDYYKKIYGKDVYPGEIGDHPIVLDVNAKERIKIISNCYTEFQE